MAAGSVADMAEAEVAAQLLGCEIRKLFPSHGYFTGTVSSFDADSRCFTVVYVDQDRELMPMSALAQHLPRQQALWIRAWLQRSAESTPGARTIANCAVDGVDEAQDDAHGLGLSLSASAGVPDSTHTDAVRSKCAMADEALGAAHQTAHVGAEGQDLVPDCAQGGKGQESARLVVLEPTGDAAAPSSNALTEAIAAGKSALKQRLATLDARLQVLATQQHSRQVRKEGGNARGEGLHVQEQDSGEDVVQTNGAASFSGNPVSTAAGDSKSHRPQQSGVLESTRGARAAAQQPGKKPQLKSKKNGGECISGLGLPDVVRELLQDPTVLKWHLLREMYEVMDGERFEQRFNELRKVRKKQKHSSTERPFSRMYNFFSLEHGDKWGKTGTLFKPLSVHGYPRNVTSTVAKKMKVSAGRADQERANHVPQGKESKVVECGADTEGRVEAKLETKKSCYLTSTQAPTLADPGQTSGRGQHIVAIANRVAGTVDGGEMMARQLQVCVDAFRSSGSIVRQGAAALIRQRQEAKAAYVAARLRDEPEQDCSAKLKQLERIVGDMRTALADLTQPVKDTDKSTAQAGMCSTPKIGAQGSAATHTPQISLCHLRETKSGAYGRRRHLNDWSWDGRAESAFSVNASDVGASILSTPASSATTQHASSESTPFSLAATVSSVPDLAAAGGLVISGADSGWDGQIRTPPTTLLFEKKEIVRNRPNPSQVNGEAFKQAAVKAAILVAGKQPQRTSVPASSFALSLPVQNGVHEAGPPHGHKGAGLQSLNCNADNSLVRAARGRDLANDTIDAVKGLCELQQHARVAPRAAFIYTFGKTNIRYDGIGTCESFPSCATPHAVGSGERIRLGLSALKERKWLASAPNKQPSSERQELELRAVRDAKREGHYVSTQDLESQRTLCKTVLDKELQLREDEDNGAIGVPSSVWTKNKRIMKLDYNEHCDYESWFLSKFKAEHIPLTKVEAFEDLRKLNVASKTPFTVDRSMHGRERKKPKHMRDPADSVQLLLTASAVANARKASTSPPASKIDNDAAAEEGSQGEAKFACSWGCSKHFRSLKAMYGHKKHCVNNPHLTRGASRLQRAPNKPGAAGNGGVASGHAGGAAVTAGGAAVFRAAVGGFKGRTTPLPLPLKKNAAPLWLGRDPSRKFACGMGCTKRFHSMQALHGHKRHCVIHKRRASKEAGVTGGGGGAKTASYSFCVRVGGPAGRDESRMFVCGWGCAKRFHSLNGLYGHKRHCVMLLRQRATGDGVRASTAGGEGGAGSSGGAAQDEAMLDDGGQYVCDLCGLKAFSSVKALNGHKGRCPAAIASRQSEKEAVEGGRARAGAGSKGSAIFLGRTEGLVGHDGQRKIPCGFGCGKSFSSFPALYGHKRHCENRPLSSSSNMLAGAKRLISDSVRTGDGGQPIKKSKILGPHAAAREPSLARKPNGNGRGDGTSNLGWIDAEPAVSRGFAAADVDGERAEECDQDLADKAPEGEAGDGMGASVSAAARAHVDLTAARAAQRPKARRAVASGARGRAISAAGKADVQSTASEEKDLQRLQDQVQLLQKQMRLMVAEAEVKAAAIRKKDEEMETKDRVIAILRREAYGMEQIDVDTGRVEVVEHLDQESAAKRVRRQADAGTRVSEELHGKLVEVKKEKTEAVGQMCQQRAQVSEALECPLCMEREARTSLSCGHCFCCHPECDDFSSPGATCPICRALVTTTIKLFGGIQALSDMLALPSHGGGKQMSMETCENAGTELCSAAAAAAAVGNSVRLGKPHFSRLGKPHSPSEQQAGQSHHLPLSIEVREAVGNLEAMGFTDREANLAMLQKHGNNVELALNELLA